MEYVLWLAHSNSDVQAKRAKQQQIPHATHQLDQVFTVKISASRKHETRWICQRLKRRVGFRLVRLTIRTRGEAVQNLCPRSSLRLPLTGGAQLGQSWTSACVDATDTNLIMTSDLEFHIESANPHVPASTGRLHFQARSIATAQSNERVKGSSTLTRGDEIQDKGDS